MYGILRVAVRNGVAAAAHTRGGSHAAEAAASAASPRQQAGRLRDNGKDGDDEIARWQVSMRDRCYPACERAFAATKTIRTRTHMQGASYNKQEAAVTARRQEESQAWHERISSSNTKALLFSRILPKGKRLMKSFMSAASHVRQMQSSADAGDGGPESGDAPKHIDVESRAANPMREGRHQEKERGRGNLPLDLPAERRERRNSGRRQETAAYLSPPSC